MYNNRCGKDGEAYIHVVVPVVPVCTLCALRYVLCITGVEGACVSEGGV